MQWAAQRVETTYNETERTAGDRACRRTSGEENKSRQVNRTAILRTTLWQPYLNSLIHATSCDDVYDLLGLGSRGAICRGPVFRATGGSLSSPGHTSNEMRMRLDRLHAAARSKFPYSDGVVIRGR